MRRSGIKEGRGMSLPRAPRPRSARGLRAKMMMIVMMMIVCAAAGLVLGGLLACLLHAAPRRPGRGPGGLEDM
jgi:hypothetical protein